MERMKGRTALVTGAADGLGAAIAARLAAEGARIGIIDRSPEAIEKAHQTPELREAVFIAGDLTDGDDIARMMADFAEKGMTFDILVNNAGGSLHTPKAFLEESDDDWERVMALNVTAAVRVSRHVLPGMVRGGYGRVINLGSKAGRYGSLFTGANYVAAKGAIQSMTLQMAQEFGPHGITCNAVCPGAILTPRVERLLSERMSPEERQKAVDSIPVRRNGRVEDVAAAVAFFASDEAGFITGQLMDVNGGQGMAS
ncbi:MAG: short-chain dehydrogenase [Rhizobiaceae bacterium]|nr:short-chain dehydrogenase [Rhizobiaceae bacterium]